MGADGPMRLSLEGRGYVVGGASRGLGRAVAAELVSHGARVVLASRRPRAAAEELGKAAFPAPADLSAPEAPQAVAEAVSEHLGGGLDGVLVNHGGPPRGRVLEYTDQQWRDSFELVLGGPIRLLRALVPLMDGRGSIVFITSTSVRQPIEGLDSSNVLRPGVAALAKVLARELAPGIRVNSVAPGRFETDRVREIDEERARATGAATGEVRAVMEQAIPLGRYGEPAELARVAAFLLSDASSYVSGAALQVDGALVTALP